jgi:DNA modification methylase
MPDPLVLQADARRLPLADSSVDLVVTSPPYFGLRRYEDGGEVYDGQIGNEPTPREYVESLLEVTAECVRLLKPSGSLWVNLGDRYAGGGAGANGVNSALSGDYYDRLGLGPTETMQQGARDGHRRSRPRPVPGVRSKSLIGVPWRYALACIDELGLILRAEVIWDKPNALPESVTDRVRRSHETWFHFTTEPTYYSAVDDIRTAHTTDPKVLASLYSIHSDPDGHSTRDRVGEGRHKMGQEHPLGRLPGSVWQVPTQPLTVPPELEVDHFAAFPMEWPRRIIQGWSPPGICTACGQGRRPAVVAEPRERFPGEPMRHGTAGVAASGTVSSLAGGRRSLAGYECGCAEPVAPTRSAVVLDPFGGTGTTALVAKSLGRLGVSVDMSADYGRLATWRVNDEGEWARALQVDKPAPQVVGQATLFD